MFYPSHLCPHMLYRDINEIINNQPPPRPLFLQADLTHVTMCLLCSHHHLLLSRSIVLSLGSEYCCHVRDGFKKNSDSASVLNILFTSTSVKVFFLYVADSVVRQETKPDTIFIHVNYDLISMSHLNNTRSY